MTGAVLRGSKVEWDNYEPIGLPPRLAAWGEPQLARVEDALSRWVGVGCARAAGRCDALCGARRRQAAAAAAGAGRGRRGRRRQCGRCAARGLRHRADPCLFAGARRPAVHGQRRAAPWQAHGAREVRRGRCAAGRRCAAGAGLRAADARGRRGSGRGRRPRCAACSRAPPGSQGMAGGQAIDLASVGVALDETSCARCTASRPARCSQGSVEMGAACGNVSASALEALRDYGAAIGLAFQVGGRHPRRHAPIRRPWARPPARTPRPTSPPTSSLLGLDGARQARPLLADALAALARAAAWPTLAALRALAHMVVDRDR